MFAIWLFPCFYLDTDKDFGILYLLPSTLTLVITFIFFYTIQLAIYTEGNESIALWMKLIGPLASASLNLWKNQEPDMPLHHVLMMINYDAVFFSQGIVDQLYFKQMARARRSVANTAVSPFFILFAILLYSLSSPQNYT